MTEEIIIDGVDVAGCPDIKQYNDTEGNMMCMEYIDGSCEGHNCFFKQLKRLEQENKDLKVLLEVANQKNIREGENTFNLVKYYRNENETLKDNINHLQAIIDDGRAENKRFRKENEELKKEKLNREIDSLFIEDANDRLYFEAEKYRKALEEIRVIADDTFKVCDDDCGNARKIKLIIDKINEVLS